MRARDSAEASVTRGEERANSLAHGLGVAGSVVALIWLIVAALSHGDRWRLVGGIVIAVSALLMFTISTLYHAVARSGPKRVLLTLDHCAIYLLTAGTYTPFAVALFRGARGWALLGLTWALALIGIAATLACGARFRERSTALYLVLGWAGLILLVSLVSGLAHAEGLWLLGGALAYSAGVPFYLWRTRRYAHVIWHSFVLVAAACHFVAVLSIIILPGVPGVAAATAVSVARPARAPT